MISTLVTTSEDNDNDDNVDDRDIDKDGNNNVNDCNTKVSFGLQVLVL